MNACFLVVVVSFEGSEGSEVERRERRERSGAEGAEGAEQAGAEFEFEFRRTTIYR